MICSLNVFFINSPDSIPDPKLRLKPDPKRTILDLKHWRKRKREEI
jgi:cobyric acid synthase